MPDAKKPLGAAKRKALDAFCAGYFAGYKEGILAAADLLKAARSGEAPIPEYAVDYVVVFGKALESRADSMTMKAMDQINDA